MEEQLWKACSEGKVEEVIKLLQNEQVYINWQNQNDHLKTPFYCACQKGKVEIVKLLLNDQRVDVNKPNKYDQTSFYVACGNGHIDIVKLLLNDTKVDANKADKYGWTPFYVACYRGDIKTVKLLLNDNRIDINKANNDGWTPFYVACQEGDIAIVQILLNDNRVDINKPNNFGETPFLIAYSNGKTEVLKYLLASGRVDINKAGANRKNDLDYTRENGKKDIVESIESFQKRTEDEPKKSTYDLEYNDDTYILKTTAKTLADLKSAIKSKLELEENIKMRLHFKRNEKYIVLDDMEDLEEGMTIKVSILTQPQSQSDSNFSSSVSNLTVTDSTNVNNECWWNTKPEERVKWEQKGYVDTKYLRYLLRNNKQNVVGNENEYLKKLEVLMAFFGGDMKQIHKAYVLFNEKLFDSFQNHRSSLFNQQRANPGNFKKDDWKNGSDLGQKLKFHDHYSKIAEAFDWNHSKFLHAIPMIHGTSETALHEICQTGLAATGATDAGFYGQGMYFSSSLFYSSRYAKDSPDGKPFIICMITPGNVYPVTESPYIEGPITQENPEGFIRRPCKLGYQSHYTLVDKRKLKDAYPITGNIDGNIANELVVFDKAQVLPLFAIYFK